MRRQRWALAFAAAAVAACTAVQQTAEELHHEATLSMGAPAPAAAAPAAAPAPAAGSSGSASVLRPAVGLDHDALTRALSQAGVELVEGTGIYAARIMAGAEGLRYREFDAGTGAFSTDFWPASSIKVVAAVGALEFLSTMGFTGAATVTTEEGWLTVRDLYEEAVRDSSNLAYDWLVAIAGVEWLNTEFLPSKGFTATVVQRSYTDPEFKVIASPPMTISEGERSVELPAREPAQPFDCPDNGNCTNLLELSQTVRRIVLAEQIPPGERFVVAPEDTAALRQALLDAEGFLEPGAQAVVGPDAVVFNKPGEVPEDDCVDVGMVQTGSEGYLLAITTPEDGRECATVSELAQVTLSFLRDHQP
jgi:hypothetical protein